MFAQFANEQLAHRQDDRQRTKRQWNMERSKLT